MSDDQVAVAIRKRKIAELARSIRKKYLALKLGKTEQDESINKLFKPIAEPLREIVESSKLLPNIRPVKKEEKSNLKEEMSLNEQPSRFKPTAASSPQQQQPDIVSLENVASYDGNIVNDEEFSEVDETPPRPQEHISPAAANEYLEQYPVMSQPVVQDFWNNDDKVDRVYGPVYDVDKDWWWFGNKRMDFDQKNGSIKILATNGQWYWVQGTPGLYQLIFYAFPNYAEDDLERYKLILQETGVHLNSMGRLKGTKKHKYMDIIRPLFRSNNDRPNHEGEGLPTRLTYNENPTEYIYWDDPNELVDRLKLLVASKEAGNTSLDNEIIAIISELKEAHIIE